MCYSLTIFRTLGPSPLFPNIFHSSCFLNNWILFLCKSIFRNSWKNFTTWWRLFKMWARLHDDNYTGSLKNVLYFFHIALTQSKAVHQSPAFNKQFSFLNVACQIVYPEQIACWTTSSMQLMLQHSFTYSTWQVPPLLCTTHNFLFYFYFCMLKESFDSFFYLKSYFKLIVV